MAEQLSSRYFYIDKGQVLKWVWCVFGCGPFKQNSRDYVEVNKSCYCNKCSKLLAPEKKEAKPHNHPEETPTHEEPPHDTDTDEHI